MCRVRPIDSFLYLQLFFNLRCMIQLFLKFINTEIRDYKVSKNKCKCEALPAYFD